MRSGRGLTLIEILIVIGILLFLFALLGFAARPAREGAAIESTRSTLHRVAMALEEYRSHNHSNLPSIPVVGDLNPDTCPYSTITPLAADAAFWKGIDLEKRMLEDGGIEFKSSELDPSGKYLVDAWGNRLRYRKLGRENYLVWSLGPQRGKPRQFHDDIGTGDYFDGATFQSQSAPVQYRERDVFVAPNGTRYAGPNLSTKD